MDHEKNSQSITAIVPAYNEAERIGKVLEVLTSFKKFKEIIVIDDGSTDKTGEIAKRFNVKYIRNEINRGKGASMDIAVKQAESDIIFFCDADVVGLNHKILEETITPVLEDKVEMFIAMRNRKLYFLSFVLVFVPLLGGERALTKRLWLNLPEKYKDRFKIETALNFYAKYYYNGLDYKVFSGLTQTIKEKKYGLKSGIKQRWGMYKDVMKAAFELQTLDLPKSHKRLRIASLKLVTSIVSLLIGWSILLAIYFGPVKFLFKLFSNHLIKDPDSPIILFLLNNVGKVSVRFLMYLGIFIVLINIIFIALNLRQIIKLAYKN